jgi:hypothetical protein
MSIYGVAVVDRHGNVGHWFTASGRQSDQSEKAGNESYGDELRCHLTRYIWNFSVIFYGIIPSNPAGCWGTVRQKPSHGGEFARKDCWMASANPPHFIIAVWRAKEAVSTTMSRIILIGMIAATLLPNARASLWEPREQVEARYGKPIHCDGDQSHGVVCTYNYQRFHVVVTFLDGKSQSELYYRSDNKYLVPIEFGKLLEMNSRENYT